MKHKLKISLILCCFCIRGISQQMPSISMFDKNLIHLNPAATGNQGTLAVGFSFRKQWTGFEGAPASQAFCAHAPLKNPNVALGLLLENESEGSTNYTGIYLNYSYTVRIFRGRLSFGLKGGINSGSQSAITLRDPVDPAFTNTTNNFVIPNFGVGTLYSHKNYWLGISAPRLFGYESKSQTYKLSFNVNHIEAFIVGGAKIHANNDLNLEPTFLIDYSGAFKTRMTINLAGEYRNCYRLGFGYRTGEALIFQVGYILYRQFSVGYSYDYNIGTISKYTAGSHELNMQYRFGHQVNASSPRYF